MPNSVTIIGDSVFAYCTNLKSIKIPDSVTSIGNYAFCDCTNLKTVYFEHKDANTITYFGKNVFDGIVSVDIYLPTYTYKIAPDFKIIYPADAVGFTTPTWQGYPAYPESTVQPAIKQENTAQSAAAQPNEVIYTILYRLLQGKG